MSFIGAEFEPYNRSTQLDDDIYWQRVQDEDFSPVMATIASRLDSVLRLSDAVQTGDVDRRPAEPRVFSTVINDPKSTNR
jgi:hypothetical protein